MKCGETYFSLLFQSSIHDHGVRLFRGRVCELFHPHVNAHVHVSYRYYKYVMPYYDLDNLG
jgi:hypothetical protein